MENIAALSERTWNVRRSVTDEEYTEMYQAQRLRLARLIQDSEYARGPMHASALCAFRHYAHTFVSKGIVFCGGIQISASGGKMLAFLRRLRYYMDNSIFSG